MARSKAPYYVEEDVIPGVDLELLNQLRDAVETLGDKMKAATPIHNGGKRVGFGVSKTHRNIAADAVIAIARGVKSRPGW